MLSIKIFKKIIYVISSCIVTYIFDSFHIPKNGDKKIPKKGDIK